jgi:2-polyprenyl-6-hydroxyphenyl methylase/3-demethylubiquinone-9 3-methyltransferase
MNFEDFARHFEGSTDLDYLKLHFPRFHATQELAKPRWCWQKACVLDIGAHWLHQSVLYALEGHHVIAADFPNPLESPEVKAIASRHGIDLLVYHDLSSESVFDSLPENSVDVVLFCEILEHITFNPVGMWRAIYRVLKPGGRIILTTPNFYNIRRIPRHLLRYFSGAGGGITVADILHVPTHSPHWKEYSKKEIRAYFETLSSDFNPGVLKYCSFKSLGPQLNWKGRLVHDSPSFVPVLREGIYAEVDLVSKISGVMTQPNWH